MVLYLSLIMCPGTSSSAVLTKFGGIFCGGEVERLTTPTSSHTHTSGSAHAHEASVRTNSKCYSTFSGRTNNIKTWYSTFSVFVSLAACSSIACVRGREEVWSSWSHTSFGVETEHTGSTPKLLTSNSRDRFEPRLQKYNIQETAWWWRKSVFKRCFHQVRTVFFKWGHSYKVRTFL